MFTTTSTTGFHASNNSSITSTAATKVNPSATDYNGNVYQIPDNNCRPGQIDQSFINDLFNRLKTVGNNNMGTSLVEFARLSSREKKCRIHERETNELKDVICSMNRQVHILTNIKRVSSDYIRTLYQLLLTVGKQDNDQLELIHANIAELETELSHWNEKLQSCNELNTITSHIQTESNSIASSEHFAEAEIEEIQTEPNIPLTSEQFIASLSENSLTEKSSPSPNATNSSSTVAATTGYTTASSSIIAAVIANLNGSDEQSEQSKSGLESSNNHSSSTGRSTDSLMHSTNQVFCCTFKGCDFKHHSRQRMVMHQRGHRGEVLYRCGIEGCDYQTNLKGNLKIHKKRRHKHLIDQVTNFLLTKHGTSNGGTPTGTKPSLPMEQCSKTVSVGQPAKVVPTLPSSVVKSSFRSEATTKQRYYCEFCDFSTNWKNSLETHRARHVKIFQ